MRRSRDLRGAGSNVDGALRRRQRVATLRDSSDEVEQMMVLKETVRLRDRERLRKKERGRDLSKRRRIENRSVVQQRSGSGGGGYGGRNYRESVNADSSDEECFEEGVEMRIHQQNMTTQLPPSPNRRGLRTLLSSPVLRVSVNEVLGVSVPRRARSASVKKLHEWRNSGNGGFGENPIGRKYSPSPATAPSNSKSSSMSQDEIEIEVAEALFDLMKQSQSQSPSSETEEKADRGSRDNNDEIENDAFQVENEQAIKEANKAAEDLVNTDGSVVRGKVGSAEERESPSFVKADACDIQYLTVTKADYEGSVVEDGTKKSSRIEIDLMALPSLPSSPERDTSVDINSETMAQDVQKKSETLSSNQSLNLNLEQQRHDTSNASKSTSQPQQSPKEPKIKCSWPGVLPHAGYVPSHRADLPRSSLIMQAPEFKFLQPRPKRCATHRYIAKNIHSHHQLVQKSLSSGLTGVGTTLYGIKSSNIQSNPLMGDFERGQTLTGGTGEDKSSGVAADFNVTTSGKSLLQQAPSQAQAQAQARNFLHNPGFTFSLGGHHQAAIMAPPNSLTNKPPATSSDVETLNAGTFNRSFFPSNEATSSYIAMLQNNGYQFPIPPNIALPPSFRSGSILNSSLYSLPASKTDANKTPQMERKNGASASNNSAAQIYSFSVQPMSYGQSSNKLPPVLQNSAIFQKLPEPSWNGGNKNFPSSDERSRNVGIPKASSFQTDYSPLIPKWDNFSRAAKVPEGSFQFFAQHIPQTKHLPVQGHVMYGNSLEGSQRLSPACRRNVPLVFGNAASQLPELKH
ncbi:Protein TIME FOR COFFEE [Striga hermonthica]|uniref:Protein TIME FOR COFFEE n=1 Tax=Striga hermonthica TaxID=68872 RepID=A0A9N7NGN2_STRHE|nr:Protein TIME FOR COFFEE [Striga hermonthica]